jgi:hypothetical protein
MIGIDVVVFDIPTFPHIKLHVFVHWMYKVFSNVAPAGGQRVAVLCHWIVLPDRICIDKTIILLFWGVFFG